MESPADERFPKRLRICKRSHYLAVQQGGRRVVSRSFLGIVLLRNDNHPARLGITTTKKIGCAVVRNRTRRLVREAFRRHIMDVPPGVDLVVIAKKSATQRSAARIFDDLHNLAYKVSTLVKETQC